MTIRGYLIQIDFEQIGKIWNFKPKIRKLLIHDNPGNVSDHYVSVFINVR